MGIENLSNPNICIPNVSTHHSETNNRYLITIDECDSPTDLGIKKSNLRYKKNANGGYNNDNINLVNYDDSISSFSDTNTSFTNTSFTLNTTNINDTLNEEYSLNLNDVRCERHFEPSQFRQVKENVRISCSDFESNNVEVNDIQNNISTQLNKVKKGGKANGKFPWPEETILVAGSSIIIGLEEKRMGKNFKVRGFSGAIVNDMYHYLHPLLEKRPSYLILMVGTNDATDKNKDAESILVELLQLKKHIESILPTCKVILSCPTVRTDRGDTHAQKVVFDLRKKLINLKIPLILNENITEKHLGKLGLHLNKYGLARLAMNYMQYMRKH